MIEVANTIPCYMKVFGAMDNLVIIFKGHNVLGSMLFKFLYNAQQRITKVTSTFLSHELLLPQIFWQLTSHIPSSRHIIHVICWKYYSLTLHLCFIAFPVYDSTVYQFSTRRAQRHANDKLLYRHFQHPIRSRFIAPCYFLCFHSLLALNLAQRRGMYAKDTSPFLVANQGLAPFMQFV